MSHSTFSQALGDQVILDYRQILKTNHITKVFEGITFKPEDSIIFNLIYSLDSLGRIQKFYQGIQTRTYRYFGDSAYESRHAFPPSMHVAIPMSKRDIKKMKLSSPQDPPLKDTLITIYHYSINKFGKIIFKGAEQNDTIYKSQPNFWKIYSYGRNQTDSLEKLYKKTTIIDTIDNYCIKESLFSNEYFIRLTINNFDSLGRLISQLEYEPPYTENTKISSVLRSELYIKYQPSSNVIKEENFTFYEIFDDRNRKQESYAKQFNEKGLIISEIEDTYKDLRWETNKQEITNYTYEYYENGLIKTMTRTSSEYQTNIFNYKYE